MNISWSWVLSYCSSFCFTELQVSAFYLEFEELDFVDSEFAFILDSQQVKPAAWRMPNIISNFLKSSLNQQILLRGRDNKKQCAIVNILISSSSVSEIPLAYSLGLKAF